MTFKRTGYGFFGTGYDFSDRRLGGDPATSRHTSHPLRLLPSGSDRVHELLLREDQASIEHLQQIALLKKCGDYSSSPEFIQALFLALVLTVESLIANFFIYAQDVICHPDCTQNQ